MERQDRFDAVDTPRFPQDGPAYLSSHKSLGACQREIGRLTDGLIAEVEAMADSKGETATIRRAPDRCILQLGPVAVTVAWLRSTADSVADGELLVMTWRGTIAGKGNFNPERPSTKPVTAGAVIEWQDTLAAQAESEATWRWCSGKQSFSTDELVALCIGKLKKGLAS